MQYVMQAGTLKGWRASAIIGAVAVALCTVSAPAQAQTSTGTFAKETANQRGMLARLQERLHERWNHILHRSKEPVVLSSAQQKEVARVSKSPETINVSVMTIPDAATVEYLLTRPTQQDDRFAKIVLPLGEGRLVTLLRALPSVKTDSGFTWRGKVEDTDEPAVLMLWRDGHLSGYFAYRGSVFTVNGVGGDVHAVAEIDRNKLPPDHAPGTRGTSAAPPPAEPKVEPFADATREDLEAKKVTIDVMLLYTKNAAKHYMRGTSDTLPLAIELANYTFRNSGLGNITLRLAHSQEINFDETGLSQFDIVYAMADGTGAFRDLKKLRNEKRADIVGLIIDDPNGCGQSTRVGADAEEAYFVVHHACAVITHSIAHEIGHILGARHDRAVDPSDSPILYAHGHVNGTKWRTMMGYKEGCGSCQRIPYWSNPRIMYKGEPTGTPACDNARVILEQAERVSQFR